MRILHTSDLHIGKRIYECSMYEEQEQMLNRIVALARDEADAIILAGDIYDRSIPSAEAVGLLDRFLVNLSQLHKPVFIISGNHDSAERLAFASRILEASQIYVSPVYDGHVRPVILPDGEREVAVYMLPFVKPSVVQQFVEDDTHLGSYDEAVRYAISRMDISSERTNILVTHQFITDAARSESEDAVVGGLDNVDVSAFDRFDYVALGHLHRPQFCGRETVRYSGTPLKYSFSEIEDNKSVTIIETHPDGQVSLREIPLNEGREWFDLRGTYDELTAQSYYENKGYQEAYVRITLTDEEDIPDGMRRLRTIYHNLLELRYDNKRTQQGETEIGAAVRMSPPQDLFAELYRKQNGQPMTDEQSDYVMNLIDQIFNQH